MPSFQSWYAMSNLANGLQYISWRLAKCNRVDTHTHIHTPTLWAQEPTNKPERSPSHRGACLAHPGVSAISFLLWPCCQISNSWKLKFTCITLSAWGQKTTALMQALTEAWSGREEESRCHDFRRFLSIYQVNAGFRWAPLNPEVTQITGSVYSIFAVWISTSLLRLEVISRKVN